MAKTKGKNPWANTPKGTVRTWDGVKYKLIDPAKGTWMELAKANNQMKIKKA